MNEPVYTVHRRYNLVMLGGWHHPESLPSNSLVQYVSRERVHFNHHRGDLEVYIDLEQ